MKFEKVENPEENASIIHKYGARNIKESDNYWLYLNPVMFGWRVTLMRKGSFWYDLDLCAGDKPELIKALFSATETLLYYTDENDLEKVVSQVPAMKTRPYYTDENWLPKFLSLLPENYELIEPAGSFEDLNKKDRVQEIIEKFTKP